MNLDVVPQNTPSLKCFTSAKKSDILQKTLMEPKKILPPPFANIQSDQRTKKYQKLCFAQETSSRENTYQTEKVLFCFTQSGRMSQNKTFYWCLIRLTNPILGECLLLNCLISGFQLQVGVTAQLELLEQTALVAQ